MKELVGKVCEISWIVPPEAKYTFQPPVWGSRIGVLDYLDGMAKLQNMQQGGGHSVWVNVREAIYIIREHPDG